MAGGVVDPVGSEDRNAGGERREARKDALGPDDPGGDDHEQAAWWDPRHAEKAPNLRREFKKAAKIASIPVVLSSW